MMQKLKDKSIKNASDLKFYHERKNPNSYFFTRDTMRFFGDTMSNYKLDKNICFVIHHNGHIEPCISIDRKRAVKSGLNSSSYFNASNLEHVIFKEYIDYIYISDYKTKIDLLEWQKLGLSYTATGYGSKIPTTKKIFINNKWYRIYCMIYGNSGTLYILINGYMLVIN